ncbi:hypothetical protein TcG_09513 [Trypanosoma cruzi]|nr:hypothetical protein TcG_09513 [Trypanosoma cruzi]
MPAFACVSRRLLRVGRFPLQEYCWRRGSPYDALAPQRWRHHCVVQAETRSAAPRNGWLLAPRGVLPAYFGARTWRFDEEANREINRRMGLWLRRKAGGIFGGFAFLAKRQLIAIRALCLVAFCVWLPCLLLHCDVFH